VTERARLIGAAWLGWGKSILVHKGSTGPNMIRCSEDQRAYNSQWTGHCHRRASEDGGGKGEDRAVRVAVGWVEDLNTMRRVARTFLNQDGHHSAKHAYTKIVSIRMVVLLSLPICPKTRLSG
jgi:hypothetical protein